MALPDEIIMHMIQQRPGKTDEALQARFGISYNTWRQIERRGLLRRSLAERLIARVSREMVLET